MITAIWALALVIIASILAAAALGIQRTRSETTDRASERDFEIKKREQARTYHPCLGSHDYAVVDVQPADGQQFICKHTAVVYRCRKCQIHMSAVLPGNWSIETFLKTQPDEAWAKGQGL